VLPRTRIFVRGEPCKIDIIPVDKNRPRVRISMMLSQSWRMLSGSPEHSCQVGRSVYAPPWQIVHGDNRRELDFGWRLDPAKGVCRWTAMSGQTGEKFARRCGSIAGVLGRRVFRSRSEHCAHQVESPSIWPVRMSVMIIPITGPRMRMQWFGGWARCDSSVGL